MVETIMAISLYIFFIGLGGFVMYTIMKLKRLEQDIAMFPTPEELAKEIVKIKIPLSDLPPNALSKLKNLGFVGSGMPPPGTGATTPPKNLFKGAKKDYIG
jgi:hypothetical protein